MKRKEQDMEADNRTLECIANRIRAEVVRMVGPATPGHFGGSFSLAEIVSTAQILASEHADGEFRLVFNTGANAGQTVFHVHAHVLAGGLAEGTLGGE